MSQSSEERVRYLDGLRRSLTGVVLPELASDRARDDAALIEGTLLQFLIEERFGPEMAADFAIRTGVAVEASRALLDRPAGPVPADARELQRESQTLVDGLAQRHDPQAQELLAEIMAAEAELEEGIASRRQQLSDELADEADASGAAASYAPADLEAYLRKRLDASGLCVTGVELLPGGRSKETTVVGLSGAPGLPSQIVLRKDQPFALVESRVIDEFALLAAVGNAGGVPVPRAHIAEGDESVLGGTFMIVDRVEGTRLGDFFPEMNPRPEHPARVGRSMARILARVHDIDVDQLTGTALDLEPDIQSQLESTITETAERFASVEAGPPNVPLATAGAWLLANVERGLGTAVLAHRDFGFGNLIARDGEVVAVLDWEMAALEPAASDLGYVRHMAEALMPWDAFLAEYRDAGGSPEACEAQAIEFWSILTYFRAAEACYYAGHIFRSGLVDDLAIANAGYAAQHMANRLLARALDRVLTSG